MRKNRAKEILNKINLGWNLGNFLDSHDKTFVLGDAQSHSVQYVTSLWGNPIFNFCCFDALKDAGINCIRIPITWSNFVDIKGDEISISESAIDYIKEIITTAIKKDFIAILDMHHDDHSWLKVACSRNEFKEVCRVYGEIWSLIAHAFKDFGENLIFEGMNEVIDRSDPENHDWVGKNKLHFKRLSKLYAIFIKNARKFSTNNRERILMISTYGAQIHYGAIKNFKLPRDKNIIVDMHFYAKETELEYYEKKFKYVIKFFIEKDIPIILGEMGAKKGYEENQEIIKAYKTYMNGLNLKCVLWDNGKSRRFIDRTTGECFLDFLS